MLSTKRCYQIGAALCIVLLAMLPQACSKREDGSELTQTFRTVAEPSLPERIAWEGHPESDGVDKTASMPRLRSGFTDHTHDRLVYCYDLWKQRGTSRSGNAYAWALLDEDTGEILIVELGVSGASGSLLVVDRWDEIFYP